MATMWTPSSVGHSQAAGPKCSKAIHTVTCSSVSLCGKDLQQSCRSGVSRVVPTAAAVYLFENDLYYDYRFYDVCRLSSTFSDAAQTPKTGPVGWQNRSLGRQCSSWKSNNNLSNSSENGEAQKSAQRSSSRICTSLSEEEEEDDEEEEDEDPVSSSLSMESSTGSHGEGSPSPQQQQQHQPSSTVMPRSCQQEESEIRFGSLRFGAFDGGFLSSGSCHDTGAGLLGAHSGYDEQQSGVSSTVNATLPIRRRVGHLFSASKNPLTASVSTAADPSYGCDICGQIFDQHDRLVKHLATRHKLPVQQPQQQQQQQQQRSSLGNGIVVASSIKGYQCDVCQRPFARSDMLTRHMRLHTGLKPYTCRICGQVFSRSDHLSTHQRTHTGEKPYRCPQCSYAACRRDMITRHLRTHTRSEDLDGISDHRKDSA
nr:EOG090X0G73 [Macrothrix elegans]